MWEIEKNHRRVIWDPGYTLIALNWSVDCWFNSRWVFLSSAIEGELIVTLWSGILVLEESDRQF